MKKIFFSLTTLMLLMAGNIANAQISVRFGMVQNQITTPVEFVSGINSIDDIDKNHTGLYGGLGYNLPFTKHLGVQLGLNGEYYTQKNTISAIGATAESTQFNLDIPVLANLSIYLGSKLKITGYGGAMVNFGLVNKTYYTYNGNNTYTREVVNWFDNNDPQYERFYTERFRWGLAYGARIGFGSLGLSAFYYYGKTDIYGDKIENTDATRGNTNGNRLIVSLDIQF